MSISTPTNEKPILFSDPMVRAILNGTKTQTRRVITPQPTLPAEHCVFTGWDDSWSTHDARDADPSVVDEWFFPYGKPGTHLWVRECWSPDHAAFYPNFPVIYRSDGYDPLKDQGEDPDHPGQVYSSEQNAWYPFKWRPSIFCPRRFSRITLRVESIRVERVNDISEEDAIAEGFKSVEEFRALWEKLNGGRGFGWDVNPYVWVVGFEVIKP